MKLIKCIGGPLNGMDMPDFGTRFFSFKAYDAGKAAGPRHVYRLIKGEWIDDVATADQSGAKTFEEGGQDG